MKFIPTKLDGVVIVEPDVYHDPRGFFFEVHNAAKFERGGIRAQFVQDNHSRSTVGTLRGLHGQLRTPQGKLVRAVRGEIFDVAVDLRPDSSTFGEWIGVELTEDNFRQLYMPPGFAHGFCVLSPIAEVNYKCTELYDPEDEIGIVWDDPDLAIDWPLEDPLLSAKDSALPRFADTAKRIRDQDGTSPDQY